MSHPNVRRLTTAVALALVLASAAPALAANRPPAPRVPAMTGVMTGLPLVDRLLDWLGFPGARDFPGDFPGLRGTHEESTSGTPTTTSTTDPKQTSTTVSRSGMIDPNG
ncbi:MAG TPA: hypothetical protein VFC23_09530 [Thermoanaerobaculia bacterium]|nr:hypothetical protein [Thermoanaerobaculia bacterium]